MLDLDIPQAWMQIGGYMHQDFFEQFKTLGEGIKDFSCTISESDRSRLREFLIQLSNGNYLDQQLAEIWSRSDSIYIFRNSEMPAIIRELRDELNSSCS